ncbi:uncharacterized protein LOC120346619 [Styela clava]
MFQTWNPRRVRTAQVVWVANSYDPLDLRSTIPVSRHKFLNETGRQLPKINKTIECRSKRGKRYEKSDIYPTMPSTRCEEWSTLRQMLPSQGSPLKPFPPNWGTGVTPKPPLSSSLQCRFPIINSPMTRYVDAMHGTNRLFKLH